MKNTLWIAGIMMAGVLAAQEPAPPGLRTKGVNAGGRGGPAAVDVARELEKAQKIVINGQTMEFVTGMIRGPVVKNAPFAAEAVTETTQKLFDGNQIVRKSSTKQYRDSEGRERREESTGPIFITDPVAKVQFTLRPEFKTVVQQPFNGQVATFGVNNVVRTAPPPPQPPGGGGGRSAVKGGGLGNSDVKQENLGTRMVEGVQAQGSRTTQTIPAGQIGNARAIEIVDERWYSPDLQLTVMTRHTDPREGETEFRLTNIQRIEQVRSLFEVPSDYQVQAGGGRGKGKAQ